MQNRSFDDDDDEVIFDVGLSISNQGVVVVFFRTRDRRPDDCDVSIRRNIATGCSTNSTAIEPLTVDGDNDCNHMSPDSTVIAGRGNDIGKRSTVGVVGNSVWLQTNAQRLLPHESQWVIVLAGKR